MGIKEDQSIQNQVEQELGLVQSQINTIESLRDNPNSGAAIDVIGAQIQSKLDQLQLLLNKVSDPQIASIIRNTISDVEAQAKQTTQDVTDDQGKEKSDIADDQREDQQVARPREVQRGDP